MTKFFKDWWPIVTFAFLLVALVALFFVPVNTARPDEPQRPPRGFQTPYARLPGGSLAPYARYRRSLGLAPSEPFAVTLAKAQALMDQLPKPRQPAERPEALSRGSQTPTTPQAVSYHVATSPPKPDVSLVTRGPGEGESGGLRRLVTEPGKLKSSTLPPKASAKGPPTIAVRDPATMDLDFACEESLRTGMPLMLWCNCNYEEVEQALELAIHYHPTHQEMRGYGFADNAVSIGVPKKGWGVQRVATVKKTAASVDVLRQLATYPQGRSIILAALDEERQLRRTAATRPASAAWATKRPVAMVPQRMSFAGVGGC